MRRSVIALSFTLGLVSCGGNERRAASDSARGDVAQPADTASMAGMDHSKMPGMVPDTSASMAGMDHSKMPGMATKAAPSQAMAGMDHSKMPGMSTKSRPAQSMAGMDHSKMPGMASNAASATRAAPQSIAGMDHSNMPGMTAPNAIAATTAVTDVKLNRLVEMLLADPAVRQRIQSDTALRRRWDEAARSTLLPRNP